VHVWIDFANSPHVATFEPVIERLRADGATVLLTAREHAQTVGLARRAFDEVRVVGDESPSGRLRKGLSIGGRALALRRVARAERPDVALSHGSYAQVVAARAAGLPAVTMMDYEHQPANHVSFRLARRVVVPSVFPAEALRRFGARPGRVVRYDGLKEELYIGRFRPSDGVAAELGLDLDSVLVVMRPAPEGALYHRLGNERFERLLDEAAARDDLQVVLLPRTRDQAERYAGRAGVIVPREPIDGRSLLAHADAMIGAGGTMNREAALLGTPTYTMFAGHLAAVDAELMRRGLLHDLREATVELPREKKPARDVVAAGERADHILERVLQALDEAISGRSGTAVARG
jgi:predicted glycosyltransferase